MNPEKSNVLGCPVWNTAHFPPPPPSVTPLTEGGNGSKSTTQCHIKSTISSHDKKSQPRLVIAFVYFLLSEREEGNEVRSAQLRFSNALHKHFNS
ncbi:hypothetical protein KOW79_004915 [Hemibagrus wyckioides]|uniref:Uncharacterized protein n=1 Tax=Hemibagrus wyckioides TaxID=337641 RepID=A0A9D3NYN4_9TELE|nr:hypothetical protein KOW79_004915 [Hemibagrus wyckioides]